MIRDRLIKARKALRAAGLNPRDTVIGMNREDYAELLKMNVYMEQHPTDPNVSIVFNTCVREVL